MYEYRLLSMHLNGTSAVGEWLLTRERPRIYELMETYPKYNENSPRRGVWETLVEGNAIYFLKNMIFYFEILP